MNEELYVATDSFVVELDNEIVSIKAGDLVRAGHPLLKLRAKQFRLASANRPMVEQTTAFPGETR